MKAILHKVTTCRHQSVNDKDQTMLLGVWRLCTCVTKADETEPEANEMKPNKLSCVFHSVSETSELYYCKMLLFFVLYLILYFSSCVLPKKGKTFLNKFLQDISPFCGAIDTPVLDF